MATFEEHSSDSKGLSVVIPTFDRPNYLRSALASVQRQTCSGLISEVLVSENGKGNSSLGVCEEFTSLPIRYVKRCPSLPAFEHFRQAVSEIEGDWAAMLGDDDVWSANHLSDALSALSGAKNSVTGYVAQAVATQDNSLHVHRPFNPLLFPLRHAQSESIAQPHWRWRPVDLLLESILFTPLNLWALVSRRVPLLRAMAEITPPHGFDSDRMIFWNLIRQGDLMIGREIGLFYRVHQGSTSKKMASEDATFHYEYSRANTSRMLEEAQSDGIDVRAAWKPAWDSVPKVIKARCLEEHLSGSVSALNDFLKEDIFWEFRTPIRKLKKMATSVLPPLLHQTIKRFQGA